MRKISKSSGRFFTIFILLTFALAIYSQFEVAQSSSSGRNSNIDLSEIPSDSDMRVTNQCKCPAVVGGLTGDWDDCTGKTTQSDCQTATCGYVGINPETGEPETISFACHWEEKCDVTCPIGTDWIVTQPCPAWADVWAGGCNSQFCESRNRRTGAIVTSACNVAP